MSTLSRIRQWNVKLIPSSRIGKLYVISGFFTILSIVLSIVLATRVYVKDDPPYKIPLTGNSTGRQIFIATHIIDVDAIAGTLTTDWYPLGDSCQNPAAVVNIYFDRNLLMSPGPDPSQIPSDQPSDQPVFQFNTRSRCGGNIRNSLATFRTVAKLVGDSSKGKLTGSSLQWYPIDRYFAQFSLFALVNSTNTSVGISLDTPFGNPVNFRMKLNKDLSQGTEQGVYLRLDVRRSSAVQFLVIIMVVANWLATIAFLWITVASFIWPETVVKELFVIPIAALFAFTSVRSNMPGAPAGFGAFMDFVGILPNLASMAIFSATLLFVVLISRTRSELENDSESESLYTRVGRLEEHKRMSAPLTSPFPITPLPVLDRERVSTINSKNEPQRTVSVDVVSSQPVVNNGDSDDNRISQVSKS